MKKALYTPPRIFEKCLKLLPIAAILACGAQQAFAGENCSVFYDNYYFGLSSPTYCSGTSPHVITEYIKPTHGVYENNVVYLFCDSPQCHIIFDIQGDIDEYYQIYPETKYSSILINLPLYHHIYPSEEFYIPDTVTIKNGILTRIGLLGENNTVTLEGGKVLGIAGDEEPTYFLSDSGAWIFRPGPSIEGNTLEVKTKNYTVGADTSPGFITGFETLAFHLPADIAAGETMLSAVGGNHVSGGHASFPHYECLAIFDIDIGAPADDEFYSEWRCERTTQVTINADSKPKLQAGDSITLIDTVQGLHINLAAETVSSGDYTFALRTDGTKLTATVIGEQPVPPAEDEGEGAGGDTGTDTGGRRRHHSSPAMGEAGLLLAGIALAGAAAPALRRRARKSKQD